MSLKVQLQTLKEQELDERVLKSIAIWIQHH